MEKRFTKLFKEYIEKVNEIKPVMLKDFEIETKKQLPEKRHLFQIGEFKVKSNNQYRFHGRGCHFSNGDFEIDWDFGYNKNNQEIWCGINAGLFCYYLETQYGKKNDFKLFNEVKKELDKLVDEGIMIQNRDLYYFKSQLSC
jgi:hypothetical protein